jgi:hypothetical protein
MSLTKRKNMERSANDNTTEKQAIKFLSDQPLDADRVREMRFGHPSIVENLKNIIQTCPTPFTIGLFGKWGTGKTTILDSLKRNFYASETATITIDAWKHEGDALRRTFLQDTIKQLKEKQNGKQYLSQDAKLSENLRVPMSRTFSSGIKANYSLLRPLLLVLIVMVGVGLLINAFSSNNLGTYISTLSGGGIIGGILLWLLQQSVTTETITTTTDRFQDPEQFEYEFKKIIDKVTVTRLLVIIDNLDRVSCEKALELLSTIKTFLEQKKCVFLIACDANAIKRHLENSYGLKLENNGMSIFDGDEYLRKFFNTYLIIPEFIDTELHSYTEDLLKESNLHTPDLPDVAYVISKAFRNNPRQIKQFINTLLTHFLLAKKREASDELLQNTVTSNVAYLAKDLIIRLQFSEYYDSWTRGELRDSSKELDDFLRATNPISVEDNRPFRYLKLSVQEIEMPEIRRLQLAFQDNKVDEASQIVEKFKSDSNKLSILNKFVLSLINDNRGKGLLLFNIVSSVLLTMQKLSIQFDRHFNSQVAELLNDDSQLGTQLQNFIPKVLFSEVLNRCTSNQRDEIIQRYSGLFSEPNNITRDDRDIYIIDLVKEFMEHVDWLNNARKQEIRSAIAQKYSKYNVLSIFIGNPDKQKELLHEDTISQLTKEISDKDVEDSERFREKVNLIIEFKSILTDKNLAEIITQFTALFATENTKPDRDQKNQLLTHIYKIMDVYNKRLAGLPKDIINPFAEQVFRGVNALPQPGRKSIFIPICIWLVPLITEPLLSQINSVINKYFASVNSTDMASVFDKIGRKSDREELINKYSATLKQRALSDQSIFDYLYPLAAKDTRTDWLTGLIQQDHQRATKKLEQLEYRVDDRKSIVSAIFTRILAISPIMARRDLYIACNKMKCADSVELKDNFVSHIKTLLKDATPDPQKMGFELLQDADYLSQPQKRDIAIETIEWLSTQQPNAAYQPSSSLSVLLAWPILTQPQKEKFLDFVFDKLIRRGINTNNIDLGFNILGRMETKLNYEGYQSYFDDILNRATTETNSDVKSHLVSGLVSLESKELNEENKNYWQKVRKLSSPGK